MTKPASRPAAVGALDLKAMTDARVALGRFGSGLPTRAAQAFLLDHARAREAVWTAMDRAGLERGLAGLGLDVVAVESLAIERSTYVRRPDLGRQLSEASHARLLAVAGEGKGIGTDPETGTDGCDVAIVVADGLSSSAVDINAIPLVGALARRLRTQAFRLCPIVVAAQARVALADPIGSALRAAVTIMLIGERPGLSAADSLGAYVTFAPKPGTPDSRRNCVSNIRDGGLAIEVAAEAIVGLVSDMRRTGLSGVGLKDAVAALRDRHATVPCLPCDQNSRPG